MQLPYSLLSLFMRHWMSEDKELQQRVQQIGRLVAEIESVSDPALRTTARQLMQTLMELHGAALDRSLEIIVGAGDSGGRIINEMARDPLVGSVLVLHGLHPDDLGTRVTKAIERLQNRLRRDGSRVDLLAIEDGAVHLRVTPPEHACASTSKALRSTVENAVYEAAPDIASLIITGLEGKPATGFVSVELLVGHATTPALDGRVPAAEGAR
jgi:Fe-S cluster biogenesis protein NfuA